MARRDKNSPDWYVGAITADEPREAVINLGFLPKGKYKVTIYEDAPGADWKDNPQAYRIREVVVKTVQYCVSRWPRAAERQCGL